MEFSVKSGSPEKQRSACIVVGVFEPRRLSPIAEQLDKISDGYISALLRRGELEGKPGQTLLLHHVPNVLSERILLIGCGKERELDERQYKQVIQKTINTLNDTGSMEAVCFLTELHVKGRNNYWKVRQAVETAKETLYSFDQLKTNKSEPRRPLRKMVFNVPTRRELTSGERAIQHGLAIAAGIKAAKDQLRLREDRRNEIVEKILQKNAVQQQKHLRFVAWLASLKQYIELLRSFGKTILHKTHTTFSNIYAMKPLNKVRKILL